MSNTVTACAIRTADTVLANSTARMRMPPNGEPRFIQYVQFWIFSQRASTAIRRCRDAHSRAENLYTMTKSR